MNWLKKKKQSSSSTSDNGHSTHSTTLTAQTRVQLNPEEERELRIEVLKKQYPTLFEEIFVYEDDQNICPICLELYTEENPSMHCKCGHEFHLQCSESWKQRSDECPVCFRKLIYSYEDTELPKDKPPQHNSAYLEQQPLYYYNSSSADENILRNGVTRRGGFLRNMLK